MNIQSTSELSASNESCANNKEANACIALGVGVGSLGGVSAALTGALCPLCIIIAPALIGLGAYKKWRKDKGTPTPPDLSDELNINTK